VTESKPIVWSTDEPTIEEIDLFAKAYGHGDSDAMGELMFRRSNGVITASGYLRTGVLQATSWMNGLKDAWDEGFKPYHEWLKQENERRQEERERLEAELKRARAVLPTEGKGSLDDMPSFMRGLKLD